MVGAASSDARMILYVMNSLHENDASGKGARTVVVKVDKRVRETRNRAESCRNFVRAYRSKEWSHP